MADQQLHEHSSPSRAPRLRFSLLALFVFMTTACFLLAWWVQPRRYAVESLFFVSAGDTSVFGNSDRSVDPQEFNILRQTQLDLIKSSFVLQAALRNPKVAALPLVTAQADPVAWLSRQLEVGYVFDSEVMSIRLGCTDRTVNDCRAIVDAVAKAYQDEAVFAVDQRQQISRDALAKSAARLRTEIERKFDVQRSKAAESKEDSIEARILEVELAALVEIWRDLVTKVEIADVNASSPPRIRLIQPATVVPK